MHRMFWPVAFGVVVVGVVLGTLLAAAPVASVDPDHALYAATVDGVQSGVDYHTAMDRALRALYGGAVGSPLAFRQPAPFLVWAAVPGTSTWGFFVAVAIGTGFVIGRLSRPWAALLVLPWMLALGRPLLTDGAHAQWLLVEFWAMPLALGAVWRQEAGDDAGAALLATCATLVRELVAPLLVVGLVLARHNGRRPWPWLAGAVVWAGFFLIHLREAAARVSVPGAEPALVGTGGIAEVIGMASVGAPAWIAAAWLVALVAVAVQRRWMLGALVAVPLLGLLVERDYWGILAVPAVFAALFSLPVTWQRSAGLRRAPSLRGSDGT